MGSLDVEFENVRKAIDEARRQASPSSEYGAPLVGSGIRRLFNAPAAVAAQAAALEAIQRMLEELKDAVELLERKDRH